MLSNVVIFKILVSARSSPYIVASRAETPLKLESYANTRGDILPVVHTINNIGIGTNPYLAVRGRMVVNLETHDFHGIRLPHTFELSGRTLRSHYQSERISFQRGNLARDGLSFGLILFTYRATPRAVGRVATFC
jgi:hypothetical protein